METDDLKVSPCVTAGVHAPLDACNHIRSIESEIATAFSKHMPSAMFHALADFDLKKLLLFETLVEEIRFHVFTSGFLMIPKALKKTLERLAEPFTVVFEMTYASRKELALMKTNLIADEHGGDSDGDGAGDGGNDTSGGNTGSLPGKVSFSSTAQLAVVNTSTQRLCFSEVINIEKRPNDFYNIVVKSFDCPVAPSIPEHASKLQGGSYQISKIRFAIHPCSPQVITLDTDPTATSLFPFQTQDIGTKSLFGMILDLLPNGMSAAINAWNERGKTRTPSRGIEVFVHDDNGGRGWIYNSAGGNKHGQSFRLPSMDTPPTPPPSVTFKFGIQPEAVKVFTCCIWTLQPRFSRTSLFHRLAHVSEAAIPLELAEDMSHFDLGEVGLSSERTVLPS